jgi:hypothetical protein
MTLRTRLIGAFLASTLLPLAATIWITTTLIDRSLRYSTTGELDRSLEHWRPRRNSFTSANATP